MDIMEIAALFLNYIREQGSYQELMAKKGEFYQMEQLQRMVR